MKDIKDIDIIKLDENRNNMDESEYIETFMFLKGYALAKGYMQTLIALAVGRRLHYGQKRKDGKPYFSHPLKVCNTLLLCGVEDDITLAAALLHDVIEDCQDDLPLGGKELISEYNISAEVVDIIKTLSKKSGLNDEELTIYFDGIMKNEKALLIKLSDRLHNSSTLYTFTPEKMKKYIRETNKFILPMASYGISYYPWYTNIISGLKSNISSMNNAMAVMEERYEKELYKISDQEIYDYYQNEYEKIKGELMLDEILEEE